MEAFPVAFPVDAKAILDHHVNIAFFNNIELILNFWSLLQFLTAFNMTRAARYGCFGRFSYSRSGVLNLL